MRARVIVALVAAGVLGVSAQGQSGRHLNPMVDLLREGKPVFGVQPPFGAGRGGATARTPLDVAKDILAHPEVDYFFNGSMERAVDPALATFTQYADALVEAGAISKSPYQRLLAPLSVKTPKISTDPVKAVENISRQLNAGVASISFVHVDSAAELQQGIAAMRFKSKGGARPDDIGQAAKYWGLSDAQYRAKADVWPLNPDGELVAWAIIETKEGLANVREIAQVKGLGVLIPGAGTLGGVFRKTNPDGQTVRDDQAWEAAIQRILAACKEFKVPCGYPANANDIETRMKQGFSVFIIQSFSEAGFKTVEIGRKAGGR